MKKKDLSELTEIEFYVTQKNGTERPYENEYWDFFETGIYVDIVSGEVLFSSKHKFDSQCGWPAFYKALEPSHIVKNKDFSHGMSRIEVRSKNADSHLGHVFTDGPAPTGLRYCINSAALEFIALKDLDKRGYSKYKEHFEDAKVENIEFEYATFGAGCFWGVEAIFEKTEGVYDAISGYCGGQVVNPTYEEVCKGTTGHAEVVQVKYNKFEISFESLVRLFFKMHDPTTLNKQGFDTGTQYRSAIFFHNEEQRKISEKIIQELNSAKVYKSPIVTEITSFETFYDAEEYHQNYYDKKYQGKAGPICHFIRE